MNANENNNTATTTGAQEANTATKQGNDTMNENNNTQATTTPATQRHYKKSILEMYVEAVNMVCKSNRSAQQVSSSGNNFSGLNNKILANEMTNKNYKSNLWLTEKDMLEQGLTLIDDSKKYGVQVFTTKLVDIPNSKKKETVLRYWTVYNKEECEVIPV